MTDWMERATRIMPGGVSSPVRAYRSVGRSPVFVASAEGAWVTDVDGRRYADLVCTWGPSLLGHAHPEVVSAVQAAAARGLSFGAPTAAEVELAELIQQRVPAAERVRFVSTGTEATMTAVRIARGATGRDVIVKFAGCYHGHSDALLAEAGSGVATQGLPGSAGVTQSATRDTVVLPYNDHDALRAAFAEQGDQIAAVITEAAPANMGVIPPKDGFNELIRELTSAHGACMIMDEVLTGFRVSSAGWWGFEAGIDQPSYVPDLFAFGKVVGGGMPLAAVAGSAELMELLAPVGPVYQAGTLSGNPLSTAAGATTLRLATSEVYDHVDARSEQLRVAVGEALSDASVPHRIQAAGNLFSVFFSDEPVDDYAAAKRQDTESFSRFFGSMLDQGVMLPPSAFEAWFLSSAHDDEAMETIVSALPAAARAARAR